MTLNGANAAENKYGRFAKMPDALSAETGAAATPSRVNEAMDAAGSRPIIILGVPRSGTTLLRVLLGSHPEVQATSETPWICGGYGANSLRHLVEHLTGDQTGPVANMTGVTDDDVLTAARAFVSTILQRYRIRSGKERVLIKTPDDLGQLDFLARMFPDADYVHIYRDGRDVACSTMRRKGKLLGDNLGSFGNLTLFSVARWKSWETGARGAIASGLVGRAISCRYEDLVSEPVTVLSRICDFLQITYRPETLEFANQPHELPTWEAGSNDVSRRPTVSQVSVGRWRTTIHRRHFARVDAIVGDGRSVGLSTMHRRHWGGYEVDVRHEVVAKLGGSGVGVPPTRQPHFSRRHEGSRSNNSNRVAC